MEQSLNTLNDEYRSLEKQDAEFQTASEYTALMDAISEGREQKRSLLDKPEALAQALDAFSTWQTESAVQRPCKRAGGHGKNHAERAADG